jgi:hypothetical protein
MKLQNFLLPALALLFTLALFPFPVSATTAVTVTSPNGGEFWGGTKNITWDFNDTSTNQDVNFYLWYSATPGATNFAIANPISYKNYCSITTSRSFIVGDINYYNGVDANILGAGDPNIFSYNGNLYMAIADTNSNNCNSKELVDKIYLWNGSSWVNSKSSFSNNIACDNNNAVKAVSIFTMLDGSTYGLSVAFGASKAMGYKLVGNTFVNNSDVNVGLGSLTVSGSPNFGRDRLLYLRIGTTEYLMHFAAKLSADHRINGFVWNGSAWTPYAPIRTFNGFDKLTDATHEPQAVTGTTAYLDNGNGNTYFINGNINTTNVGYVWNGNGWLPSIDANNGILTTLGGAGIEVFNTGGKQVVIYGSDDTDNTGAEKFNFYGSGYLNNNSNATNLTTHCTYPWNTLNAFNGTWYVDIQAIGSTVKVDSSNSAFILNNYSTSLLPITPIQNVASVTYDSNGANITNVNDSSDTIFKVQNNVGVTIQARFSVINSLTGGSQYFVYSSTDGVSWVFDDTLTFGATNSTPVQKVWDATNSQYIYSFHDSLSSSQVKYYKLVFQPTARYWETINSSSDWVNQNPPTQWQDSSGKKYDIFSDSNYTNVQSYTSVPFQNLVSSTLTVGYELQFTAYATTTGTLKVGYRTPNSPSDSTSDITVTSNPTRFSIPIAPATRDAVLLIKSVSTTSNTYYITDYAIVPRSYWVGQLEITNSDNTPLQAILQSGSSYPYVVEGDPVKLKLSAYDTSGTLGSLVIQTLLGGTVVKTQTIPINNTVAGTNYSWNQQIDGVIDLNGLGGQVTSVTNLRDITYKAILYDSNNNAVSEEYKVIKLVQYPYFPNDLKMSFSVLNAKLGTNPKIEWSIQQKIPENFLGFDFAVYDSSHSVTAPNYYKRIYATDLGCATLLNCTKQLAFDDWVFEGSQDTTYFVTVTALLNTENKNFSDSYANVSQQVLVSASGYDLAQLKQYYERYKQFGISRPYKSTEQIPLVFAMSDDQLKDLTGSVAPYFTLVTDNAGDENFGNVWNTPYFPVAYSFDQTSGINYWMWDTYLFDDYGAAFANGTNVKFDVKAFDSRSTNTDINHSYDFALTSRCILYSNGQAYPDSNDLLVNVESLFSKGNTYINQFFQTLGYGILGCLTTPAPVVHGGDANEIFLTIDNNYTPSANAGQSVYCAQKYDNNVLMDQLGDSFSCISFLKDDEVGIDGLHLMIGNNNSDYSISNENKQFLDFVIPKNDILFSDLGQLIVNWNSTNSIGDLHTAQDVVSHFIHDTFDPSLTPDQIRQQYHFTKGIGEDLNFPIQADFNAGNWNKVIFFTVSGISVVNMRDYLTSDQLVQIRPSQFLSYANANNLNPNIKKATITIYNNSSDPYKTFTVLSALVINNPPTQPRQVLTPDGNIVLTSIPDTLNFQLISDLQTKNQTVTKRLVANLAFNAIIKANPLGSSNNTLSVGAISKGINDILFGKDDQGNANGLLNNPVGFAVSNILFLIALLFLIIIGALVAKSIAPFVNKTK